jgi:citrate synthase
MSDQEKHEGLEGVVIANSSLTKIFGDEGRLVYRGISIEDLAEHSTFEEVTKFLWDGKLPTQDDLDAFRNDLAERRQLPDRLKQIIELAPDKARPMDVLRSSVSMLGTIRASEMDVNTDEARREIALDLVAILPTIVATFDRLRRNKDPVRPRKDLNHAENFLFMLNGEEPDEEVARAMDIALILHADHGFNASTFSARVTGATLADFFAAITSAIGTLSGPLHGGANEQVLNMLREIEEFENTDDYLDRKFENSEKIMGFGHRVYNEYDPRARVLKEWSRRLNERNDDLSYYKIQERIEERMINKVGIDPNVDFWSASVYNAMGIEADLFTPIFACSRIAGWTANLFEQMADNRLIRPLCNYTGPDSAEYVPIEERS